MLMFTKMAVRLTSRFAASLLLLGGVSALAAPVSAGTVTLTASAKTTTLPDGTVVPMWGLACNDGVSSGVTCAAANAAAGSNWSPVVITVNTAVTTSLTITLQNQLAFNGNSIPTSLVVLGQVGGGLGSTATTAASPLHAEQTTTWPAVDPTTINTPPGQVRRVQSFATEVAAGSSGTYTFSALRPGTYLIQSGTHPSIQSPMGLYGVLVVTAPGQAYPSNANAAYDADLPVVLSEIDPLQNSAVDTAVRTTGFNEMRPWSGLTGDCGDASVHTCYPPAVNYSPRYYLVNGVSFDRGNIAASSASVLAPASQGASVTSTTGKVLVRYVNAGLRMHVPTIVGLNVSIIAEDGNILPGNPRVQSEVFLAAGKTHDVMISPKTASGQYTPASYPIFDRQLSLTTNSQRDGGMQAYLKVAGGASTGVGSTAGSQRSLSGDANKQYFCQAATTLHVSDPNAGLLAGVVGANGVSLVSKAGLPAGSSLDFHPNGTFSYAPPSSGACGGSFTFAVNGAATHTATIAQCDAAIQAGGCSLTGKPLLHDDAYTSTNAKNIAIAAPGVLVNDVDADHKVLQVNPSTIGSISAGLTVSLNADGSFYAQASAPGTYSFTYNVLNTQKVAANAAATVTVTFPVASGLQVHVRDDKHPTWGEITDYRWIIEEDRTFWHDPKCQVNHGTYGQSPTNSDGSTAKDSYGHDCPALPIEALGYNFHSAGMPTVATGCVGTRACESQQTLLGAPAVCDVGNGICRTDVDPVTGGRHPLSPADVKLDPYKHYFISIMPADGVNPALHDGGGPVCTGSTDANGACLGKMRKFDISLDCPNETDFAIDTGMCGHNMGGAQIAPAFRSDGTPIATPEVTVRLIETPLPPANISILVYEDDYPLNGENDAGGGIDMLANNEAGLADFQIILIDQAGQLGDNVGQVTFDMFNMPLSNALADTVDPMTGLNACPVSSNATDFIVGTIVTCPKYESDHVTMSPLSGQAVIANLPGGLYEVQGMPNADRIARGEEWLQTNTLDGGKPHEAFIRPGEPRQFQEFGPGGFHVQIGFANPKIINSRRHNDAGTGLCDAAPKGGGLLCNSTLTGHVHGNHMSRTPDERTYDTGSYDAFAWSACYVSIGIPDEEDIAFTKCDGEGNFSVSGMPNGTFKVAVFDQWNDIMLDGLVSSIDVAGNTELTLTATQWRTNMYTRAYLDLNGNGIPDRDEQGNDLEPGLNTIPLNIRYRDGSVAFLNQTDGNGYATWNEVFPLMAWLVVEPDYARYKSTGVHVVYDAGGPDDCSPIAIKVYDGNGHCSKTAAFLAGTAETVSLPVGLRVPGAVYCENADCLEGNAQSTYYNPAGTPSTTLNLSSGRIDPPQYMEGWQGLLGQHSFIDFGYKPYAAHENGGIKGMVTYGSTRPFDDPMQLFQNNWEPGIANVTVNLYKKGVAADGTATLTLVDTVQSDSFDTYSQGFRTDGTGNLLTLPADGQGNEGYVPNMNCPGQDPTSGFFATLRGSKMWIDTPDPVTHVKKQIAYKAQFKCFDGWAMLNQVQPTTYDGHYSFPSVTDRNPLTGRPSMTNCTGCVPNPDDGNPMLPAGQYVLEVVPPTGYELVKEEDKNILFGDVFVAPVLQQFNGLGAVFIMPDQATVAATYNPNNRLNPSTNNGFTIHPVSALANNTHQFWPCVGTERVVPDYNSLYPEAQQVAPFAGATRALCDRKEINLTDQMGANAEFYLFTKAHKAGRFYGVMSDDMASEFDPFSPAYGEKFGPPNLPVGMRNFAGDEVVRVYADQWGLYNGLFPSSWEVNPPTPSGYAPQMSIACMNDAGPILDQDLASATYGQMITDPAYNPAYSNFCYEHPHMPGVNAYMDTPVTPVQAFADHYNLPDAEYPDGTPMIKRADFAGHTGPWTTAAAGVGSVAVTTKGTYTAVPTVGFTGGAGTDAAATAIMSVGAVNLTTSGSYTAAPTVGITGGGGSGATATACLGINVQDITFAKTNPAGASAGTPLSPGNANTPVGVFNGTGTAATVTVTTARPNANTNRRVTVIHVTDPGCYTVLPTTLTIKQNNSTTGQFVLTNGSNGTSWTSGLVVTLGAHGTGYTSVPTVGFTGGTGSGAVASATLEVNAVNVTAGGVGYTSAPTVTFTGSGGAVATATLGARSASSALVLKAFGDRVVQNPVYTGPNASEAPYNSKTIVRHYGFGRQCTAADVRTHVAGCNTVSSVQILGPSCGEHDFGNTGKGCVTATINSWTDTQINATIPAGVPDCVVQQHGVTGNNALCGEVVIVSGSGKQSIDGITVTIGGKAPTIVTPNSPSRDAHVLGDIRPTPLQTAIDNAASGDLIIVDEGTYRENLIMWKPVRLQGVGAGAVHINGDGQPAEHFAAWRRQISCLFGLTTQGAPNVANTTASFDPEAGLYSCPNSMYFRADRLPFEGFVGWDTSSNGNLMQLIIEPSLMGAYEGAGITVVGRGVNQQGLARNDTDFWGQNTGGGPYADGAKYLSTDSSGRTLLSNPWTSAECASTPPSGVSVHDYYTGNFDCNPSTIDGFTVSNSSQGGGGIFMHGWSHHLQLANNRITANAGTLAGGINLGNGEIAPAFILDNVTCGATGVTPAPLCPPVAAGAVNGLMIPFRFEDGVRIHHNQIINNASIGDALFSYVPSGSGGVTISGGADNYEVDHNWIAANLTAGDGAGIAHMGMSEKGRIHNNFVLFNESNNPTLEVDGGGILISGAQEDRVLPDGNECGGSTDSDCPPGLGFGAGHDTLVDANLILGNGAAYGSGGGIRLRQVNGAEVANFPKTPSQWFGVTLTNNIIVNNVAGWDGGGISMQDTFKAVIANNTIVSNDTTSSAGVLFKTMSAMMGASPQPGCVPTSDAFLPQNPKCLSGGNGPHMPQPAGLVTMQNTPNIMASMAKYWDDETGEWVRTGNIKCPDGFGYGTGNDSSNDSSLTNGRCLLASLPKVVNTMFWQNRAFHVAIVDQYGQPIVDLGSRAPNGQGLYSQQNIVALLPTLTQTYTGQCVAPNATGVISDFPNPELYWDVGVRMDQWNTPALRFNAATINGGYTMDAVATATLQGTASAVLSPVLGQVMDPTMAAGTAVIGSVGTGGVVAVTARGTTNASGRGITAMSVTTAGSGYTVAPTVTIAAPTAGNGTACTGTCTTATAHVTVSNGQITGVVIDTAGAGYRQAANAITVTLTSAKAVTGITVASGGSGYSVAPTVTFSGGGGTGATAHANLTGGVVTSFTVDTGGSGYTSAPMVSVGTSTLMGVASVAVTNGGLNYASAPTLTLSAPPCTINGTNCVQATATATLTAGTVTSVTVTAMGAGYTVAPTVTLSGEVFNGSPITKLNLLSGGVGFAVAPTVAIDPPPCTLNGTTCIQATATATLPARRDTVSALTLTNPGAGYTSPPWVSFQGGGLTPNFTGANNNAAFRVTAKNSIFSDNLNAQFASADGATVDPSNVIPTTAPILGQYCNGARVPPEECSQNLGVVYKGTCAGYNVPAGVSESPGTFPLFVFDGIKATATTDEGNNWINMVYGPLTLTRPTGTSEAVGIVATPSVAQRAGVYTLQTDSVAVDAGQAATAYTNHDFFGNDRGINGAWDIGAMELPPIPVTVAMTKTASVSTAQPGDVYTYTITATNNGDVDLVGGKITDSLPTGLTGTWTCAATGGATCAAASGTGNLTTTTGAVGLPTGGSVTFVYTTTVTTAITKGNKVNTATLVLPKGYSNVVSNTASATVNVTVPPPALTSISPVGMARGATLLVPNTQAFTLTGTYLGGVTSLNVAGTGVTCNAVVVVSATSVTANCTAYSTATAGGHNVTVTNSSGDTSNAVTLNIVTTPPTLTVANQTTVLGQPVAYKYANTVVGNRTAATFTVANPTGSGGPVTVGSINLTGTNAGDFQLGTNNCTANAGTVAEGASCTFVINFVPSGTGSRIGNVTVTVPGIGDLTLPMNILQQGTPNLSGTGVAPANPSMSPASLNLSGYAVSTGSLIATSTASTTTLASSAGRVATATAPANAGATNGTTFRINRNTIAGAFVVGQTVSGTGIAAGAKITALTNATYRVLGGTGTVTVDTNNTGTVSGTITAGGLSVVTVTSATGFAVGQTVTGTGITAGTTISSITGTALTLSQAVATAGVSGNVVATKSNMLVANGTVSGTWAVGEAVSGTGIAASTTITAVSGNTLTLSADLTATPGAVTATSGGTTLLLSGVTGTFATGMNVTGASAGIPANTTITGVSSNTITLSSTLTGVPGAVTGINSAAYTQTLTVTNTNTVGLLLSAPAISGTNAASFVVTGGTCTAGSTVAASGGTCTVIVTLTPATGNPSLSATLTVSGTVSGLTVTSTAALTGS